MAPADTVTEGLVTVSSRSLDGKPLFYNPPQVFNRDLSLVVLKTFVESEKRRAADCRSPSGVSRVGDFVGVNVLEMLAATGIRSIRYLKELGDYINHVYINDLDRNSAKAISLNCDLNGIPPTRYRAMCADGNQLAQLLTPPADMLRLMLMNGNIQKIPCGFTPTKPFSAIDDHNRTVEQFLNIVAVSEGSDDRTRYRNVVDVIDIDPYSTATVFLDSAIRCVKSGGALFVTSTDMPTLCGNNPLVSFYKYGGSSIKATFCHELSLRILLYTIATTAAKYQRVMEPLISCSADFYVRVFVRISNNTQQCKHLSENCGVLLLCAQCDSFRILKLGEYSEPKQRPTSLPGDLCGTCEECGGRLKIGGPLYIGPIHNKEFVNATLQNAKEAAGALPGVTQNAKIIGILTAISEELEDVPLHYNIPCQCQKWNLTTISPSAFKRCLEKLGYRASHFHREPQSLKTDAPNKVVMDIIRHHAQANDKVGEHSFFKTPIQTEGIDLTSSSRSGKKSVARWVHNPTSHWGPKKMHRQVATSRNLDPERLAATADAERSEDKAGTDKLHQPTDTETNPPRDNGSTHVYYCSESRRVEYYFPKRKRAVQQHRKLPHHLRNVPVQPSRHPVQRNGARLAESIGLVPDGRVVANQVRLVGNEAYHRLSSANLTEVLQNTLDQRYRVPVRLVVARVKHRQERHAVLRHRPELVPLPHGHQGLLEDAEGGVVVHAALKRPLRLGHVHELAHVVVRARVLEFEAEGVYVVEAVVHDGRVEGEAQQKVVQLRHLRDPVHLRHHVVHDGVDEARFPRPVRAEQGHPEERDAEGLDLLLRHARPSRSRLTEVTHV
ncbi:tRNA (guanine(26)-N(2))-dimethyltransferase, putative [Babesia caballi]|uniref:tRNA (guanine(26)-N(2))-dimethyltransferase n=1 Tax=Babesia caballi TaxID=5871 RepID=A0AAV4LTU6_BABCB|nr:tRNA (guanine(26)-N(2))-dimethyltransferase, putative [Babesia caballi]